jgi:hypothetical protein
MRVHLTAAEGTFMLAEEVEGSPAYTEKYVGVDVSPIILSVTAHPQRAGALNP